MNPGVTYRPLTSRSMSARPLARSQSLQCVRRRSRRPPDSPPRPYRRTRAAKNDVEAACGRRLRFGKADEHSCQRDDQRSSRGRTQHLRHMLPEHVAPSDTQVPRALHKAVSAGFLGSHQRVAEVAHRQVLARNECLSSVASRLLYLLASESCNAFRPAASAFSWSNRLASISCQ
jgi:hypothetical protein